MRYDVVSQIGTNVSEKPAAGFPETLVHIYQSAWHHIRVNPNLNYSVLPFLTTSLTIRRPVCYFIIIYQISNMHTSYICTIFQFTFHVNVLQII
jgi:hypothetical protein